MLRQLGVLPDRETTQERALANVRAKVSERLGR